MSKQEFMEELKVLLFELPEEEREEAIRYYDSYFTDAGEENEQQVIAELGSAGKVATQILKEFREERAAGAYTEHGYQEREDMQKETLVKYETDTEKGNRTEHREATNDGSGVTITKKGMSTSSLLLLVIIGIIGFPIWMSILGAGFGLIAAVFGVVFGFGVAGIACFIAGVITLIVAIAKLVTIPLVGVVLLAVALIVLGLGCLFVALSGVCVKLAVWMVKGIINLLSRAFHGKRVATV